MRTAGSELLRLQLSCHVVLLGFGQKVGCPRLDSPCLTWGMAAQRRQVAPQGHTASSRQSQVQLRHTQKTDGHTLCPGQSWPME